MLQVKRFFRKCRMLLRHCCWCGRGLTDISPLLQCTWLPDEGSRRWGRPKRTWLDTFI